MNIMSNNITKIHFSDFCKNIIDNYKSLFAGQADKFESLSQLVNLYAYIWNIASSAKKFRRCRVGDSTI